MRIQFHDLHQNPRLYKPRICIACRTLQEALRYANFIGREPLAVTLSELTAKIEELIHGAHNKAIVVTVDKIDYDTIRLLRLIDPYTPVILATIMIEKMRIVGRERTCFRVLI